MNKFTKLYLIFVHVLAVFGILGIVHFKSIFGVYFPETTFLNTDMKNLLIALELYKKLNGTYPSTNEGLESLIKTSETQKQIMSELPNNVLGGFNYVLLGENGPVPIIWSNLEKDLEIKLKYCAW